MSNFQDWSVGIGKETVYGTAVTVSRFLEFTEPKPFVPDLGVVQGSGIRPGSRVARSARRVQTLQQAAGSINVELFSKGLGLLWEACMGAATSQSVSDGVYQQVFKLADDLPSHTIQFGAPNAAGAISPITFMGCMIDSWELGGDVGQLATLATTWDARETETAGSYAAPTYPSGGSLFRVQDAAIYSGTLTMPTATALASATAPIAGVKSFKITCGNALVKDRFFAAAGGLKAKPLPGTREPKIELGVEYGTNALRDAWLADTPMSLLITLTAGALTSGLETLQVVIPEIKLDGGLPEGSAEAPAQQSITASVLDNLALTPLAIVARTSDTAL
jgi:hypothetical protein